MFLKYSKTALDVLCLSIYLIFVNVGGIFDSLSPTIEGEPITVPSVV